MRRHFLSLKDVDGGELDRLVKRAVRFRQAGEDARAGRPLAGRVLALFFEAPSLRTRVSLESAVAHLGGTAIFFSSGEVGLGKRESVADAARTFSQFVSCVAIRCLDHEILEEFARHASVPVLNALSDRFHPCQVVGDLAALAAAGKELRGLKVAFIGEGNNVAHSWLYGAAHAGCRLVIASPPGYGPDPGILEDAISLAGKSGGALAVTEDPREAASGADVVYTDVWASMGREQERVQRVKVFAPYQVNAGLVALAESDAVVMHCLPAHRGEEITDDVLDGPRSIVMEQARMRLHSAEAILEYLVGQGS